MYKALTISIKAEATKSGGVRLSKVITYESGNQVEIPINCDGSVKWFNDTKLIKKQKTA